MSSESSRPPAKQQGRLLVDPKARKEQISFLSVNPLHWVSDKKRPAPNPIIRGSLFGVLPKQQSTQALSNFLVYEDKNIQINYTGPALGQADLDVWLNIVRKIGPRFAEGDKNSVLEFTPGSFLREIGRTGGVHKRLGKNDRDWLYASLVKLTGTITIATTDAKRGITGGLIRRVAWNDDADKILVDVDNTFGPLFAGGYTCLNPYVRSELKGDDLALWLYAFINSHSCPHAEFFYGLETLMERSRTRIEEPRKFKYRVAQKMKKLMALSQEERGFYDWLWDIPGTVLRVFFSEVQMHKYRYQKTLNERQEWGCERPRDSGDTEK